ncbi:MAG: GHMP kinase, partial [Klebsiella michiganensis]|nr:GHMP kinase [Klebsiella michiganensis]
PGFDTLRGLVEECDLYGINVAHSGSVVGLMLDRQRHDIEYLQRRLGETRLSELWPRQHLLRMVQGGVELR